MHDSFIKDEGFVSHVTDEEVKAFIEYSLDYAHASLAAERASNNFSPAGRFFQEVLCESTVQEMDEMSAAFKSAQMDHHAQKKIIDEVEVIKDDFRNARIELAMERLVALKKKLPAVSPGP